MNTKSMYLLSALVIFIITNACTSEKTELFNGKDLDSWDVFIGKPIYNKDANKSKLSPFSVVSKDGSPTIKISGEVNASLCTKKSYSNYHLSLEFKYGGKVYDKRNSGLLYHSVGNFGEGIDTWKSSIEFQMMEGNVGAMYCMGNTNCQVNSVSTDSLNFTYDPNGDALKYGLGSEIGKYCMPILGNEKEPNEWNKLDLYCLNNKAIHILNGKVVCIVNEIKDGNAQDLTAGQIQLQSEGAELFIKNINIKSIENIDITY
ncbi:MAG: DUF1080 domain-containing protein [Bacteroidales bacterium]